MMVSFLTHFYFLKCSGDYILYLSCYELLNTHCLLENNYGKFVLRVFTKV